MDNYSIQDAMKVLVYSWVKEAVLDAMKEFTSQQSPVYPEKVGIAQASEITGFTKNSLYQMHSRGQIPGALKVGGKLLFDTETLRNWINSGGIHLQGSTK